MKLYYYLILVLCIWQVSYSMDNAINSELDKVIIMADVYKKLEQFLVEENTDPTLKYITKLNLGRELSSVARCIQRYQCAHEKPENIIKKILIKEHNVSLKELCEANKAAIKILGLITSATHRELFLSYYIKNINNCILKYNIVQKTHCIENIYGIFSLDKKECKKYENNDKYTLHIYNCLIQKIIDQENRHRTFEFPLYDHISLSTSVDLLKSFVFTYWQSISFNDIFKKIKDLKAMQKFDCPLDTTKKSILLTYTEKYNKNRYHYSIQFLQDYYMYGSIVRSLYQQEPRIGHFIARYGLASTTYNLQVPLDHYNLRKRKRI